MKLDIETDIEWGNNPLSILGLKLQVLQDALRMDLTKVSGFNNTHDVDLSFFEGGKLVAHLGGSYDDSNDTVPAKFTIYGQETFQLNWHPLDTMGGYYHEVFENQFANIYRK